MERRLRHSADDGGCGELSIRCKLSSADRQGVPGPGVSIRVECQSGYRGAQEPLAFWLGERRLAVHALTDRWYAPEQRWFRVHADDGSMYVLRHDEASGTWEIAAYRRDV
ncbi:hypothetical protein C8R31_102156 [Nitrosospira sp. Nsp2]|nr:hypothetical protein C8R31_102156 [Nitrosospira sp. Nsp2]